MSNRSQFWAAHLTAIERESITTKAYAEQEGLSVSALYDWRKRLHAEAGGAGNPFVAVRLQTDLPPVACTLAIGDALRLSCASLPDATWLAALARALDGGRR
ncbi:IS66 family insertion sequence element accessory protein TnpA [Crenobacter caeni]|uniref:Cobyrinic acid ac-diamide synthase n=1 Tax=Crenobacter caeni TaxID=2705474 RepID=A0A6B2KVV1_9NEIS|nr:cobyrinic acid ac-diamide synthase [Crenobacter caeni]NDV14097.1 cobyrinic acid ac-diamide synthase [Crenobacter caeni]